MRTMNNLIIIFCLGILSACTLLVEVKDQPANNANNTNNQSCGNELIDNGEDCDGDNLDQTMCRDLAGFSGGTLACDASCHWDTSACSVCGNEVVEEDEACDGGNLDGKTCESLGYDDGQLACNDVCDWDVSDCVGGICGNGFIDEGEPCDGSNVNGQTCESLGRGFTGGELSCKDDCSDFETGLCTGGSGCGDGQIEGAEECDGPNLNNQSCATYGFADSPLVCDGNCRLDFSPCAAVQMTGVIKVVTGEFHACALTLDGIVFCWGDNSYGQLGLPGNPYHFYPTPTQVPELPHPVSDLAAGAHHTCVVMPTGNGTETAVFCWGDNSYGQAGFTPLGGQLITPEQVLGLDYAVAVVAGANHTCARQAGGTMYCWGDNSSGQLGVPIITAPTAAPQPVGSLTGLLQITAGGNNTCAIKTSFEVYCWGMNNHGQVGNDTTTDSPAPTRVYNSFMASHISTGGTHTCAVGTGSFNGVFCWGLNDEGQLGQDLTTTSMSAVPVSIPGFTANFIAAGDSATCAGTGDDLYCWGRNDFGQLGINSIVSPVPSPTQVPIPTAGQAATAVSQPSLHACAVTGTQQVYCWGYNYYGQLGDGSRTESLSPVPAGD